MLSVTFDAPPLLPVVYVVPDPTINLSLRFGVPFVPSQSCHPDGTVAPDHIMMPPTGIVPGPSNPELARALPQMSSVFVGFVALTPTFPFDKSVMRLLAPAYKCKFPEPGKYSPAVLAPPSPVPTYVAVPETLILPLTSSGYAGDGVPIPTFPLDVIRMRSAPAFENNIGNDK